MARPAITGPTTELSLKGMRGVQRALREAPGKVIKLAAQALYLEAEGIMAASKPLVPVFLNALRGSGHVQQPRTRFNSVEVVMGYGGAAADYAVYVHEGTGPAVGRPKYFPPVSALEAWAKKKLGDAELAYVVARKIYNEGTEPVKYLEKPFRAAERGMARRVAKHIAAGWRR